MRHSSRNPCTSGPERRPSRTHISTMSALLYGMNRSRLSVSAIRLLRSLSDQGRGTEWRDYPRALFYLNELVELEDAENLDRAYFIRGRIYHKQGRFDLSIDSLSHVAKEFPESSLVQESQYWIASNYYGMGMYEKAIEEFIKVTDNPASRNHAAQALLRIGDSHYNLGSYLEASLAYLEVVREFPESREAPRAEFGILLCYERQEEHERFMDRASSFFATYPDHPLGADILWRIAQHHLGDDQFDKSIFTYRALVRKYPRSDLADDAQLKLGEIYRNQEDFKNAIIEFGLVVKHYPRSDLLVEAYFEIAEGCFALGDYRRALEGYERVASGFPESHLARRAALRAIDCLERLDRVDLAEKRLAEFMERDPKDPSRVQEAPETGVDSSRADAIW